MEKKTFAQKMIENRILQKEQINTLNFQDNNDYSDYFDEAIYSESYSWSEDYSL